MIIQAISNLSVTNTLPYGGNSNRISGKLNDPPAPLQPFLKNKGKKKANAQQTHKDTPASTQRPPYRLY